MPKSGQGVKIVPPGEFRYVNSLTCDPDATSFSYSYRVNYDAVDAPEDEGFDEDEDNKGDEEDYGDEEEY
jgi:hypothetical protein